MLLSYPDPRDEWYGGVVTDLSRVMTGGEGRGSWPLGYRACPGIAGLRLSRWDTELARVVVGLYWSGDMEIGEGIMRACREVNFGGSARNLSPRARLSCCCSLALASVGLDGGAWGHA